MRRVRKCQKCGEDAERKFLYCPYCGMDIEKLDDERMYGLLGKSDKENNFFDEKPFMKGMPFSNILNSLMQEFEKQFKEIDKDIGKRVKKTSFPKKPINAKPTRFSINISSGSGKQPEIRIRNLGDPNFKNLLEQKKDPSENKEKKLPQTKIPETKLKKLASLPKQEAETKIRRLGNKIIYEINLPGVKSMNEVFLTKLENSTEVKAFSKDKGYFKLIPSNLPIKNYALKNGKLIIEFTEE